MSSDIPSHDPLSFTQETTLMHNSPEPLNAFMSAPVRKLHADEYIASDLDGVTEGHAGSGNLNFLMMQAGQTDSALMTQNPYAASGLQNDGSSSSSRSAQNSGTASGQIKNAPLYGHETLNAPGDQQSSQSTISLARGDAAPAISNYPLGIHSGPPAPSPLTAPSSASSSAPNGVSGQTGSNGTSGLNGSNGSGNDGAITNITNTTNNTTTNNYNETHTTNNETTVNVIGGDTSSIVENIYNSTTELVTNVTNEVADILTTVTNNVFETINNILDGNGLPLPSGPIGLTLDATLDQLTNLNLDLINSGNVLNVINETINLSPILDPLASLTGDLLSDTSLGVILNPFQYDSSPDDTDLHADIDLSLLGLNLLPLVIDVPLNPVEALLGDLDINLDLTNDLLGLGLLQGNEGDTDLSLTGSGPLEILEPVSDITSGALNLVEDLAGDIDIAGNIGLGIFGNNENAGIDSDISIPLNIDLLGLDIVTQGLSIPLDPVEAIIGDIDIDLGIATNLLGNTADALIDTADGGTGGHGLLAHAGDIVGDVGGEILHSVPHIEDLAATVDSLIGGLFDTVESAVQIALSSSSNTGGLDLGALIPGYEGCDNGGSPSWTESVLPDVGGILGDTLAGIIDAPALDPVALAAPVISLVTPVTGGLLGGGLLGGGHSGGLFG